MGRVLTNNVGLAVVEEPTPFNPESSPGSVAADHKFLNLEPNTLGTFGATIATTVRNPISASRQRKKGTITDLDSSAEFEHDVIYDVVKRMMRGFMFAKGVNEITQDVAVTAVPAATTLSIGTDFTGTTGKIEQNSLIWAHGFDTGNGLKVISAVAATLLTTTAAHSLTGTGTISLAGFRTAALAADDWQYAVNRGTLTLDEADITSLKKVLFPGQLVHIGSIDSIGGDVKRKLTIDGKTGAGYARVRRYPSVTTIEFDKVGENLQGDNTNTTAIDIMFGDFIKPVPATNDMFLEQSYMFELFHPDLNTPFPKATDPRPIKKADGTASDNDDAYVYSVGNFCNTMGINLPLTDKATISFAYIGTDTEIPVETKKDGQGTINDDMKRTEAMNTVNDIARLRVLGVDEAGITTDFKSLTFNINNNASPEKVLRKLGARYMNVGSFDISIEAQCLFTNPLVLAAIRRNDTVSMDFILANNDGVLGFDIPGMTLGDGGREYPENESVLVNFTCETFEDDVFKSSFSFSMIPVPLPTSEE